MDSNNFAENHLIWSKKNSSKNGWRWFLAGTLLNLTVTSLIVGSMLFYVHEELQSVRDQLLSHEGRLFTLEKHVANDATLQQGTPEVNDQTWKKAQLRMRRDYEPQMKRNMTFQSGFHTSQPEPLLGIHSPVSTCRDGKDGKDGRDGRDGKNGEVGRDGVDGRDGKDGNDGRDGREIHLGQPDSSLPPIGQGQGGLPGPPGERGPTGETGIPGPRGLRGEPGPSGETGSIGYPGESGISGPRGFPGASGETGQPGESGIPGPRGLRGKPGPSGETGPYGHPGESGKTGLRGFPGVSGETGQPGESGPPGEMGRTGERGQRGEPGPPGQQGFSSSGPTYIRWGRTTCPDQAGTELVYQGYGAGSKYTNKGGSSDLLCLPTDPDAPASYQDGVRLHSQLHGMEYELAQYDPFSHDNSLVDLHDYDVPCAVCRLTSRGTQLLVPAKNECPDNWTKEYNGYLMTDHYTQAKQQAVCVDQAPEVIPGSQANDDGALLYLIEAVCGSLQCPPYVSGREISCAICSI